MASTSIHRQHSHSTLPLAKLQKLERLSLYYNLPEVAIICTKCGFALSPKRASEHPGKKHGITRSARHGLKPLLYSLNLPDPDTLAPRPNGSQPHPYLTVQEGSSCSGGSPRYYSQAIFGLSRVADWCLGLASADLGHRE
ncbi:hypothetical protein BKA60DRAFT_624698 [Fusarium oxysporum]|nr:hypothetical protein BKA60DRAFT_624805 [Fusarium oxysporum]KAH7205218.1 hypothetical protein BKA60DRAFT_624698 [Fusarium oxysporum]